MYYYYYYYYYYVGQVLHFVKDKSKVFCTSSPCNPHATSNVFTNKVYNLWITILLSSFEFRPH